MARNKADKRSTSPSTEEKQTPTALPEKEKSRTLLTAVLFLCAGLGLLAYDAYGLATNSLRMLLFGRFSSTGGIFLYGPPLWALSLAYLSFSVFLIANAVAYWNKRGNEAVYAMIDKVVPGLALILYIGAAVLANKMNLHH